MILPKCNCKYPQNYNIPDYCWSCGGNVGGGIDMGPNYHPVNPASTLPTRYIPFIPYRKKKPKVEIKPTKRKGKPVHWSQLGLGF